MSKEKLKDRARDELFSHVNRCGVLQALPDDQKQWMDETIDYLAERYPDLADQDLDELHAIGMRFCKPAIPHGADLIDGAADITDPSEADANVVAGEPAPAEAAADANAA